MTPRLNRAHLIRGLVAVAAWAGCILLWIYSPRMVALPVALALLASTGWWVLSGRWFPAMAILVIYVGTVLSPIDVRWTKHAGFPKVVPVVMGYPTAETADRASKGELWLGGCVVFGTEPRWVLLL